jgi:hypothetical protein
MYVVPKEMGFTAAAADLGDADATVTLIALLTMVATDIVENKLPDWATKGEAA